MAKQQTSFEERLARIEQSRGGPTDPPSPTPPPRPRPPRKGGGGGYGPMIGAFVGVFVLAFAAMALFTIVTIDEDTLVSGTIKATNDELAGKHTIRTVLQSDALTGLEWAPSMAAAYAKRILENEDVSPEKARQLRAFIASNEGKSMAEISREHLRRRLTSRAREMGGQPLADEISAKLDACRSITCLETVNSLFMIEYDNYIRP